MTDSSQAGLDQSLAAGEESRKSRVPHPENGF
jgi:hypothetical protein